MLKKCTPLWREAHVEVSCKKLTGSEHSWTFRCRFGTLPKVSKKREGFVAISETLAGMGLRTCKDACRVASGTQETYSPEILGGQGGDFLRGGCILEHQIFRFARMIL